MMPLGSDGAGLAGAVILVIDIGGTQIKFGYSVGGRPHDFLQLFPAARVRCSTPVESLAAMVGEVTERSGITPSIIVATVPGFIDVDEDVVLFAGNIPELNARHLARDLGQLTGCPVLLERDSVLALTGETIAGAARGCDAVLGVFFGTGIGAAFMQDGRPFRGAGWALEIGHIPFRGEGRTLEGLRQDCLEVYASGRVLEAIATRHAEPVAGVFEAALHKADLARELDIFVRDQAFAVGTAVALLSPRTIIVGGGVVAMAAYPKRLLAGLIAANAPFGETRRPMDLRWADLGWTSVLQGAPSVAAEHFRRRPELFGKNVRTIATRPG
jgi:predicted NBD/HSP70 family sugar kinase